MPNNQLLLSLLVFAFQFAGLAVAQTPDLERIAPHTPPTSKPGQIIESEDPKIAADIKREKVLVSALKGIVFVSESTQITSQPVDIESVKIVGLLNVNEEHFTQRFSSFLGQALSLNLLDKINREVVRHYRENDLPVVDSLTPQGQDITNGVVQILVLAGKLGGVKVEGARHFASDNLRSGIRLKNSDTLSQQVLEEDIRWLNNNPFRTVNLLLEQGEEIGETDIVLKVDDRLPLRVYGGVDDSGTELTGKERWYAGFNWGNAFGLDHQLSYQFTSSFDVDELNAHTFNYVAPLSWRHTVSLFGAYVDSDPAVNTAGFDLKGESWQLGGRYSLPLKSFGTFSHTLGLGADFKRSNNDLQFGTLRVFNTFTNIVQFNLAYQASVSDSLGFSSLDATLNFSPGGISNDNSDAAFSASRAGASADYLYARFNLNRLTRLPHDYSWVLDFQLQVSNSKLLGSEQLGIGGYRTVRAYDEYAAVGDKGITLRNELRTPAMSLLKKLNISGSQDNLQFLVFVDYAIVSNVDRLIGENSTDLLSSGVGLRYDINPNMSLRADYGWQLTELAPGVSKGNRMHASLVIGY